jgi:hypothetical protein
LKESISIEQNIFFLRQSQERLPVGGEGLCSILKFGFYAKRLAKNQTSAIVAFSQSGT